jgi:hypothetical protein
VSMFGSSIGAAMPVNVENGCIAFPLILKTLDSHR